MYGIGSQFSVKSQIFPWIFLLESHPLPGSGTRPVMGCEHPAVLEGLIHHQPCGAGCIHSHGGREAAKTKGKGETPVGTSPVSG